MGIVKEYYDKLEKGKSGLNKGKPFTIPDLSKTTGGIMKDTYYLILGKSKSGKSSFLYVEFIFNIAYAVYQGKIKKEDFIMQLFSLEISVPFVLAKAAVWFLFKEKGYTYDTRYTLGYKKKVSDATYNQLEADNTRMFLSIIEYIISVHTRASLASLSNVITPNLIELSTIIGTNSEGESVRQFNNPNLHYFILIDHLSLSDKTGRNSTKDTMDNISQLLTRYRNSFGTTIAVVQQITPMKGQENVKLVYGHEDARDTKNTFQDCDICLSINSAFHDKIDKVPYHGEFYYILPTLANGGKGLKDTFRLIGIEKNRDGESAVVVPATFIGAVGHFNGIEIPSEVIYKKDE